MAAPIISYENFVDAGTVTNESDGTAVQSVLNLQTRQPGVQFEQQVTSGQNIEIRCDLGEAKTIRMAALFNHNVPQTLTISTTYDLLLGSTAGGSDVFNGTLINFWSERSAVADDAFNEVNVWDQDYSARYVTWKIAIESESPQQTYNIKIGRLWVGNIWRPSLGLDGSVSVVDPSRSRQAIGQARFSYRLKRYRRLEMLINNMNEQNAIGDSTDNTVPSAHHMDTKIGTSGQLVVVPDGRDTIGGTATEAKKHYVNKTAIIGHIDRSTPIEAIPAKDGSGGWRYRKRLTVVEER